MTEMSWYLEAIMSVTSVESTTYHCCLSSPSTEAILQVPRDPSRGRAITISQGDSSYERPWRGAGEELRRTSNYPRQPQRDCYRAHEDECNDENYNPRQGAKATSATKPMRQVLRYKTHEHSNMAVAVRRAPLTNPRAQSAALHGKSRPDHVHARAMA